MSPHTGRMHLIEQGSARNTILVARSGSSAAAEFANYFQAPLDQWAQGDPKKRPKHSPGRPYRQRAMEWLANTEEIKHPLLRSFKRQLIQWDEDVRAGKQTYKLPLSEKQLIVLCDHVFRAHPDWIAPAEEDKEPDVEVSRFDPWTGNTSVKKVSPRKAEIEAARQNYYRRSRAEEKQEDGGAD